MRQTVYIFYGNRIYGKANLLNYDRYSWLDIIRYFNEGDNMYFHVT